MQQQEEKRSFLESHLASALLRRKTTADNVLNNRPSFPPPTRVERPDDTTTTSSDTPALPPSSHEEATPTSTNPYVGASATTSSTRTYVHSTKNDDLHDYLDSPEIWKQKVKILADLIKDAKCLVIYTGAGVSTNASIPDYRSMDGVWTALEKGVAPPKRFDLEAASPTFTHRAIAGLVSEGLCKLLVSTNIDGLHRRSGVPYEQIAELHGNCYREVCEECSTEYLRDFSTIRDGQHEAHYTGRLCDKCNGKLKDSIVNFGESLPERDFQLASKVSLEADLTLVAGSSMRVSPACNMPRQTLNKLSYKGQAPGKMIIINKQKTPFESEAWLHIFADTDEVFQELLAQLHLTF